MQSIDAMEAAMLSILLANEDDQKLMFEKCLDVLPQAFFKASQQVLCDCLEVLKLLDAVRETDNVSAFKSKMDERVVPLIQRIVREMLKLKDEFISTESGDSGDEGISEFSEGHEATASSMSDV